MTRVNRGPWPDVALPPGNLLAETLEALGMSQTELAMRMSRPLQAINEIIKGKKAITPETALELERVLGTPAHVWLNLEQDYQFNKTRLEDLKRIEGEVKYLADYPYSAMAKLGWVPHTKVVTEKVRILQCFFAVASLAAVPTVLGAAFRKSAGQKESRGALAAWLRKGELAARGIDTMPYSQSKLKAILPAIRGLTRERPDQFERRLCELCARAGIVVVFVPHLPGTYAHGATRWLHSDRALIQLSLRCSYADIFWFSFFHEIGHLLCHGKREIFVDSEDMEQTTQELEADRFAADILIPPLALSEFLTDLPYSAAKVEKFAKVLGITSGIVVGRLQYEKVIPRAHLNGLRPKLTWSTGRQE